MDSDTRDNEIDRFGGANLKSAQLSWSFGETSIRTNM